MHDVIICLVVVVAMVVARGSPMGLLVLETCSRPWQYGCDGNVVADGVDAMKVDDDAAF